MKNYPALTFLIIAVAVCALATGVALAARGGPDNFGYTYQDSNEPGGPAYAWEEISTSGTLIPIEEWTDFNDGYAGPIPIGFDFGYYGTVYDEVFISTNGYITFGEGDATMPYPPHPLPHPHAPDNDIGIFGWDMELYDYPNVSAVYFQILSDPTRLVIEYVDLRNTWYPYDLYTFEVILYAGGEIKTQYQEVSISTDYAGIENADGSDGLNYRPDLYGNLAVQFNYPNGIFFKPYSQAGYDLPGRLHSYSLHLMNRSGRADRYDLMVLPDNNYTVTLSITQTEVISHGENYTFTAWVQLPPSASPGDIDEALIEARSVTSPTAVSSTTSLQTTVLSGELAYVTHYEDKMISLVDTGTHAVVGTVDIGEACNVPDRVAISPQGNALFASCQESESLTVVDTHGNMPVVNIPLAGRPSETVFTRDGAYALVGIYPGGIQVFDTATFQLVTVIPTINSAWNLAAHPLADLAYAAMSNDEISVIDTTSFTIIDTIPLAGYLYDILVSPDGRWLFASLSGEDSNLTVIDTGTNTVYTSVPLNGYISHLAVTRDGSRIFVTAYDATGFVEVIDGNSFTYLTSIYGTDYAYQPALTCDDSELYVTNYLDSMYVVDTQTYTVTTVSLLFPYNLDVVICPQHVITGIELSPGDQSGEGEPSDVIVYQETLTNFSGEEQTFDLELGGQAWTTTLSVDSLGPLADWEAASFTISVTVPGGANWLDSDVVVITATAASSPTLFETAAITTIADAPPQFDMQPLELASVQLEGSSMTQTLTFSNPGFAAVEIAFYEFQLRGEQLNKAFDELKKNPFLESFRILDDIRTKEGVSVLDDARILYDRSHGEPSLLQYSHLVNDLYTAGTEIVVNYMIISPEVLEGFDILWVNCCGNSWSYAELTAVSDWLAGGGAVLVQGEDDPVTAGPASVYEITYQEDDPPCLIGETAQIVWHPVTAGVEAVWIDGSCFGFDPGPYGQAVVYDPFGRTHAVAAEHATGKMVAVADEDFLDTVIEQADNRLFANRIFTWLARPRYGDVPWLAETPAAFFLPGYSDQDVTVTFDASTLAPGIYTATLAIEHNDAGKPLPVQVPVTLTVIAEGAGVNLAPTAQAATALPGEMVAYTFTLTNLGNITDSFTLAVSSTWTATLSAETSPPLGSGQSFTFNLSVTTPISATDGMWDVAQVTATSDYDGSVSAAAQATTTVAIPPAQDWYFFLNMVNLEAIFP